MGFSLIRPSTCVETRTSVAGVDYQTHRLLKKSSGYDNDVALTLHQMETNITVQLMECPFPGKVLVSVTTFLLRVKSEYAVYGICEANAMWMSKEYLKARPKKPHSGE